MADWKARSLVDDSVAAWAYEKVEPWVGCSVEMKAAELVFQLVVDWAYSAADV